MLGIFKVILSQTLYLVSKFPINRLPFELLACGVCQGGQLSQTLAAGYKFQLTRWFWLLVLMLGFPICWLTWGGAKSFL